LNENYEPVADINGIVNIVCKSGSFVPNISLFNPEIQSYNAIFSSKVTIKSIVSVVFLFENQIK
jgi:hypothetical protein